MLVRLFLIVVVEPNEGRCFGILGRRGLETWIEDVPKLHLGSAFTNMGRSSMHHWQIKIPMPGGDKQSIAVSRT